MIRTRRAFDPHSIQLVIFDLDGTLIDSRLDLVHSVNAALRHIERPELPDDVIASYVGDGAPILIQRALGAEAGDEALVRKGLEFFLSYYREHKLDHTTVYPGIAEALAAIQNSPERGLRARWRCLRTSRSFLRGLSSTRSGWDSSSRRCTAAIASPTKKPEPEGARKLLEESGVSAGTRCDRRRLSRRCAHRSQCRVVDGRRHLRIRSAHPGGGGS